MTPRIVVHLKSISESTLIVFTDGSRDLVSGRASFGVYVEQIELKIIRISNGSSVITTELMAILLALCWIEEARPK